MMVAAFWLGMLGGGLIVLVILAPVALIDSRKVRGYLKDAREADRRYHAELDRMMETLKAPNTIRQAAFREAREAIRSEYLEDPHCARPGEEETGDEIYNRAIRDCENALSRLEGWPEEEGE